MTTLAQEPTIRVPDGAENPKGVAVQSVLPDWDDKDQSTLLSRPIYDEAIYGAVRFHHRSVREYLADAKRPDLRFHGVDFDGPVPVALKLADKWTGPAMFERLENQLCADYLRDNRSNRGIFLLVYRGEKAGWDVPVSDNHVDFAGLTAALLDHWRRISPKFPNVDDIVVIGIDLTKRSS